MWLTTSILTHVTLLCMGLAVLEIPPDVVPRVEQILKDAGIACGIDGSEEPIPDQQMIICCQGKSELELLVCHDEDGQSVVYVHPRGSFLPSRERRQLGVAVYSALEAAGARNVGLDPRSCF